MDCAVTITRECLIETLYHYNIFTVHFHLLSDRLVVIAEEITVFAMIIHRIIVIWFNLQWYIYIIFIFKTVIDAILVRCSLPLLKLQSFQTDIPQRLWHAPTSSASSNLAEGRILRWLVTYHDLHLSTKWGWKYWNGVSSSMWPMMLPLYQNHNMPSFCACVNMNCHYWVSHLCTKIHKYNYYKGLYNFLIMPCFTQSPKKEV